MRHLTLNIISLAAVILAAVPLWPQVTAAVQNDVEPNNDSHMLVPPPISGEAYAVEGAEDSRSNYLRAGLSFSSAYSDNVMAGAGGRPVSDISYSIWPTLALDKSTARLHSLLSYRPGFTFYRRFSTHNEADENLAADVQYRVSSYVTVSLRDSFQKTSNFFSGADLAPGAPIFGSVQVPTEAVIAPIADRLTNSANAEITYQYSPNGMAGVSGTFTNLHYPKPAEVPGLFDSSSQAGSGFYNHRLSKKHYFGFMYEYQQIQTFPGGTQNGTQIHTVFAFYTLYLKSTLSLSLSGGPQRYEVAQFHLPAIPTWSPFASASLGWQGRHSTLAASYARTVTGGGGLAGAFHSNVASVSTSWQWARTWNIGLSATYSIYKNVEPFFFLFSPGGHTISGSASIRHQLGEHFNVEAGYMRLHQSYSSITAISAAPDTNRESFTISYGFTRPLGR